MHAWVEILRTLRNYIVCHELSDCLVARRSLNFPPAKMLAKFFTLSLACAAFASAQSASLAVSPAAETLAATVTPANLPLFDSETIQLTDNVVAALRQNSDFADYASLVEFEDSANSTLSMRTRRARRALRCKTMPGDDLYPSKAEWDVFDKLLGGALEKIVPIASPCYKDSEYDNYDAAKCATLVKNFDAEEL